MKTYTKVLWIVVFSLFVLSCEKWPEGKGPDSEDSDAPEYVGGNKDSNDHRNQNDETGIVKGDDYGDLYVLHRTVDGVPYLGCAIITEEDVSVATSLKSKDNGKSDSDDDIINLDIEGIWYPEIISFVDGVADGIVNMVDGEIAAGEEDLAQEVDFGRISLIRSPQSVLDDGLVEAISGLTNDDVDFVTTDGSGRLVAVCGQLDWADDREEDDLDDKTIDSPRENMAIYGELMKNGIGEGSALSFLTSYGFTNDDVLQLAASAFAAGSDKTGTIMVDEIVYVNGFMGISGDLDVFSVEENAVFLSEAIDDIKANYDGEDELSNEDIEAILKNNFKNYEYYSGLRFFDFGGCTYNRSNVYGNKKLSIIITELKGDEYITTSYETTILEAVFPSGAETGLNNTDFYNLEGFTMACDDAVQVLEFIHDGIVDGAVISSIEYIGED